LGTSWARPQQCNCNSSAIKRGQNHNAKLDFTTNKPSPKATARHPHLFQQREALWNEGNLFECTLHQLAGLSKVESTAVVSWSLYFGAVAPQELT